MSKHNCRLTSTVEFSGSKLKRFLKGMFLVSKKNPRTALYFRSDTELETERKRQLGSKFSIIHPLSDFRIYYELLMIGVFLMFIVATPLEMYFDAIYPRKAFPLSNFQLCAAFFINVLDIVLSFHTGYADEDSREIIIDKRMIRSKYSKSFLFIADLIATFPIDIIVTNMPISKAFHIRWIQLLFLSKLFRLPTTLKYMNNAADLWHVNPNIYLTIRYVVFALLICHWTACLSGILSKYFFMYNPSRTQQNWIREAEIDDSNTLLSDYVKVIFRTAGQLLGVTHGLYPNLTMEDKVITVIVFTLGYFLMSFVLIIALRMILNHSIPENVERSFINDVDHFMGRIKLDQKKRTNLRNYYEYRFREHSPYNEASMSVISEQLQLEVAKFVYRDLLKKVEILNDLRHESIDLILKYLQKETFMPGDYVTKYGSTANCMYFIMKGTVAIMTCHGVEVCHLHDGAYFGEIALIIQDNKRTTDAVALEICEICILERKHFLECIDIKSIAYKKLLENAMQRQKHLDELNEIHLARVMKQNMLQRKSTHIAARSPSRFGI